MADAVEMVVDSTTNVLPDELLSQIFIYLPLADRKRVRLVCRSWYGCCISANVTKREKFVFRADSSIEEAVKVIQRSSYPMMNLEFQGLPVIDIPVSILEERGNRIRGLEFHRCQWDDQIINNILLHCEHLKSFQVPTSCDYCRKGRIEDDEKEDARFPIEPYSPRLLNDLIENGIRRPNLHTLSMSIERDKDENLLRQMLLIHPYIKHLSVTTESHMPLRLDQCLNPNTRLESLICDNFTLGHWMNTRAEHRLRLKRMEITIICGTSMKETIYNFFKSQKDLEVVRLYVTFGTVDEIKDLIRHILESCPKLREFRLETSEYSIANLARMSVYVLEWPDGDVDLYAASLRRGSFLKHLRLLNCWDTLLQEIFQYLPGLETLVLKSIARCSNFGFTGRNPHGQPVGYSIKSLQQLKHLELSGYNMFLTKTTALELQLPRLEFLSLNVEWCNQLTEETLNDVASHLSNLRVLTIALGGEFKLATKMKTAEFCGQLENLRRLIFRNWRQHYEFDSFFYVCPRLKYIYLMGERQVKFRNSTGKVLSKDARFFKFPGKVFKNKSFIFLIER